MQSGGYGEIDDEALNAQDIAGPEDAPAFSISRKDSDPLKELLEHTQEITVTLDADSRVTRDCTTYNIVGTIPGKHPDRMVLLSAHYDSYFSGFRMTILPSHSCSGSRRPFWQADSNPTIPS